MLEVGFYRNLALLECNLLLCITFLLLSKLFRMISKLSNCCKLYICVKLYGAHIIKKQLDAETILFS